MTKKKKRRDRDPREWTNPQIQQDPDGYKAAQQAHADDLAAAEQQRRDADDRERFVRRYVEEGGRESDAAAAWTARRNQQAAEAAGRAENEAMLSSQAHVRSRL